MRFIYLRQCLCCIRVMLLSILLLSNIWLYVNADTPANILQVVQLTPSDLQWGETSAQLHGLQTIRLVGDPQLPGPYAERIRLPAHFKLPPHSHTNEGRMVTVLSGTLYYAYGDTFDESKLTPLPPGSFFTEPKDLPHYATTRDHEVILQLNAIGPAGTTYIWR